MSQSGLAHGVALEGSSPPLLPLLGGGGRTRTRTWTRRGGGRGDDGDGNGDAAMEGEAKTVAGIAVRRPMPPDQLGCAEVVRDGTRKEGE